MGTTLISMFIRIKKRKNAKYTYLVKNKRYKTKKYPKQIVISYLGKVYTPKKTNKLKLDFSLLSFKDTILKLIETELLNHNFKLKNSLYKQENIIIDLKKKTIHNKKLNPISIELNEGFLNNHTLNELLNFNYNPKQPPLTQGHNLANLLISAGIKLSPSKFLKLFKKIHNP